MESNCLEKVVIIMPVNRDKTLRHGSLLGTEPLEGFKERWKSESTAKSAQTALNEFAARFIFYQSSCPICLGGNTSWL